MTPNCALPSAAPGLLSLVQVMPLWLLYLEKWFWLLRGMTETGTICYSGEELLWAWPPMLLPLCPAVGSNPQFLSKLEIPGLILCACKFVMV